VLTVYLFFLELEMRRSRRFTPTLVDLETKICLDAQGIIGPDGMPITSSGGNTSDTGGMVGPDGMPITSSGWPNVDDGGDDGDWGGTSGTGGASWANPPTVSGSIDGSGDVTSLPSDPGPVVSDLKNDPSILAP